MDGYPLMRRAALVTAQEHSGWRGLLSATTLFWVMLWLNIDADYDRLVNPSGIVEYMHAVRVLLAFAAAVAAVFFLRRGRTGAVFAWKGPVRLMAVYGLVALTASVFSVQPFGALYYGALFVSVFIVLEATMAGTDPLDRSAQLLTVMWVVVAATTLALTVVSWDILFGQSDWMFGDKEIISEMPTVAGLTMSRSTGVGRFAAVAATLAFARLYCMRGANRLLWTTAFCLSVAVVLGSRARMPLFGLLGGVLFILLSAQRSRVWLFLFVCVGILVMLAGVGEQDTVARVVYRRGPGEDLTTMTGRTELWREGWQVFLRSPLLGLGPLADRFHMGWWCVSSTWLLALMQAGVVGTAFFVASWAIGWRLFFRNLRSLAALSAKHQVHLIEAGAVLAFFTLRSIPETTAAAFSVDLLVIVPILAYLEILDRSLRQAGVRQGAGRGVASQRLPAAMIRRDRRLWNDVD